MEHWRPTLVCDYVRKENTVDSAKCKRMRETLKKQAAIIFGKSWFTVSLQNEELVNIIITRGTVNINEYHTQSYLDDNFSFEFQFQ